MFFTAGCLAVILAVFLAGSLTVNMVMDITFYGALATALFFALALFSYAILASTLARTDLPRFPFTWNRARVSRSLPGFPHIRLGILGQSGHRGR